MINKKKEGGFYASKVRLFLNEYDGVPLEEFCKAENVSYSKMCNCLGWSTDKNPSVPKSKPRRAATKHEEIQPQLPTLELKELVVDMPSEQEPIKEDLSRVALIKPNKTLRLIENINISINDRIGVNIGRCDVTTLSALIREMEVSR